MSDDKDLKSKVFKPQTLKRMEEGALKTDLDYAADEGDLEKVIELSLKGEHTYERELAARGIERGSEEYWHALEYSLMFLYEKRMFYAHFFVDVVRVQTFRIPTAGVRIHQARIELSYNPDFLALNSPQANAVVLQHEAGHCFQGHTVLRKRMPESVLRTWAYTTACELAVNTMIQDIVDHHPFTIVPSDLLPLDDGGSVKEHQSWEYYYNLLKDLEPPPPPTLTICVGGQGQEEGEGGGGGGQEGEGDGEGGAGGDGDVPEGAKAGGGLAAGQLDDHDDWDNDSDGPDIQAEVIKQAVAHAYNKSKAAGSHMRGYMPGELVDRIEELLKDKSVPFERVFRSFVGSQIKYGRRPTIMRVSRRRQVPPGNVPARSLRVLWYQDDSGSVSIEEKALCRSELYHASLIGGVVILFQKFCCGLVGDMVDLSVADFRQALEVADGGTDFESVIDHAHEVRPDLVIIATDGEAPTPSRKPPCPMAWVLTSDGRSHPWGTIIRMPTIPEIKHGYKAVIERWAPR